MKILLAVDGSDFTKKMLAYLVTHDELFTTGNEYSVFTAQAALPARARAAVGKEVVDQFHKEEAEKILGPVCKFLLRHGIDDMARWPIWSWVLSPRKSWRTARSLSCWCVNLLSGRPCGAMLWHHGTPSQFVLDAFAEFVRRTRFTVDHVNLIRGSAHRS